MTKTNDPRATTVAAPAGAAASVGFVPHNKNTPEELVVSEAANPSPSSDGFAWDDAGIGAGAALLVVVLGAGLAGFGARKWRRGRSNRQAS